MRSVNRRSAMKVQAGGCCARTTGAPTTTTCGSLGATRFGWSGRTPLVRVRWTEAQARAFQLLHVLPHELGHHRDRMTTRSRRQAARGEPYAERYADAVLERLWPTYDLA